MYSADLRTILNQAARENRWLTRREMATELRRLGLVVDQNDVIDAIVEIKRHAPLERRMRDFNEVEYQIRAFGA